MLKLNLGCGRDHQAGFVNVDALDLPGVDVVCDLTARWPWEDDSVDEALASHVVEHFTAPQRIHFVNELYRVLKPAAKATLITPHWCSTRAYGDLTHQWPPVSEFWFFYLKREWRELNAPHNSFYTCDFDATWGHGVHQDITHRTHEFQQFALSYYKEAAQDLHATLIKR